MCICIVPAKEDYTDLSENLMISSENLRENPIEPSEDFMISNEEPSEDPMEPNEDSVELNEDPTELSEDPTEPYQSDEIATTKSSCTTAALRRYNNCLAECWVLRHSE